MINRVVSFVLSLSILISSFITGFIPVRDSLRIAVPENWELCVGDGRSLECVFSEKVKNRNLSWSVEPSSVASVDKWGRVTARAVGKATVTARGEGFSDSVELNVVETPTMIEIEKEKVSFEGKAINEVENLQKLVYRFPHGSSEIPENVASITDYDDYKTAVTADGAVWEITNYGVLRTDKNAPTERDVEQRFMGDRYFYSNDSQNVLAIVPDGDNGIWTIMESGVTHIVMMEASGRLKASYLSGITQNYVARHGYVDLAYRKGDGWVSYESDNDGLWTSMYGAGELMRYAALRDDPNATAEEIAEAKEIAYRSSKAVLMLYYISMRTGTTEAYIRRQIPKNIPGNTSDRWLSGAALEKGGDSSVLLPAKSPAKIFNESMSSLVFLNSLSKLEGKGFYGAVNESDWSNPAENENIEYEKRTRFLEGFPVRTYSLKSENTHKNDYIYWSVNSDSTATGVSTRAPGTNGYLLNGENLRGVTVDASGEVPERLWNDLLGEEYSPDDIIYKTDTSADELIGHMFIFKLMYDIIAPEDPEIKELLVNAIDNLAQHISDNSYMLCDATGQPATWSNFSRSMMSSSSAVAESSLHALVLLSVFKTAAYITGYQKWENEYRMAALDPAYEYAKVTSQHYERMLAAIKYFAADATIPLVGNIVGMLQKTDLVETVYRFIVNYSSEEMAMLGFYVMFQLEEDEQILRYYRQGIDDWWVSIKYSENPLWYYIYQLAYPDKKITDYYGNDIIETAAWSLSRHPADLVMYSATNPNRDDVAQLKLSDIGLNFNVVLSYNLKTSGALPKLGDAPGVLDIIKYILSAVKVDWAVAPPDERALHKYNSSSYYLEGHYNRNMMEGSTTYTLPYWMGVYHGMLSEA
ncbi:MAG: Ig-like domain-containing protein [Clostridia bacterium]|nr:Ig-like domain-containing protein [Clostridia bacterium]